LLIFSPCIYSPRQSRNLFRQPAKGALVNRTGMKKIQVSTRMPQSDKGLTRETRPEHRLHM
jgi:hypothetical protein